MPIALPENLLVNCTDGLFICMSRWANEATQGWWWTMILLGFCVVIFVATQKFGTVRSFGTASFIGMMGSIYLGIMGLMSWYVMSAFIITGFAGIIAMVVSKN